MNKEARSLILQALGAPETESAPDALGQALDVIHAEAEMLLQGENIGPDHELLEHAHVARLNALKLFIDQCLTVDWSET